MTIIGGYYQSSARNSPVSDVILNVGTFPVSGTGFGGIPVCMFKYNPTQNIWVPYT